MTSPGDRITEDIVARIRPVRPSGRSEVRLKAERRLAGRLWIALGRGLRRGQTGGEELSQQIAGGRASAPETEASEEWLVRRGDPMANEGRHQREKNWEGIENCDHGPSAQGRLGSRDRRHAGRHGTKHALITLSISLFLCSQAIFERSGSRENRGDKHATHASHALGLDSSS
jgi:hypothetical protein